MWRSVRHRLRRTPRAAAQSPLRRSRAVTRDTEAVRRSASDDLAAGADGAALAEADRRWMAMALREAIAAGRRGEVPVGAVVVCGDQAVARAGNASIRSNDPAGHAEVRALRAAG